MAKRRNSSSRLDDPSSKQGSHRTVSTASGGGVSSGVNGRQRGADAESVEVTQLDAGKSVTFTGEAILLVREGALWVFGKEVTAASGPVELSTGGSSCAAVLLEALAVRPRVPLLATTGSVFSLIRPKPDGGYITALHSEEKPDIGQGSAGHFPLPTPAFSTFQAGDAAAPACLHAPQQWRSLAADLVGISADAGSIAPLSLVVCGSKQTGKSTCAQLLVNSLLNKHPVVAFLDTDCGQPEFTPPGLISLTLLQHPFYGAPHQHQQKPSHALFVGDISAQSHPALYIACVRAAFQWFVHEGGAAAAALAPDSGLPPLVINTPGWVKGIGLDMLADTVRMVQPSHVLQLQSPLSNRNLPTDAWWQPQSGPQGEPCAHLHLLLPSYEAGDSLPPNGTVVEFRGGVSTASKSRSPVESRTLSWTAFANTCLLKKQAVLTAATDAASIVGVAQALAAEPPFVISLKSLKIQVLHAAVSPDQLPYALAGAVVGLATASELHQPLHSMDTVFGNFKGAPLVCHALGIIRAVDVHEGLLYLLTPLSEADMLPVDTLQDGSDGMRVCKRLEALVHAAVAG